MALLEILFSIHLLTAMLRMATPIALAAIGGAFCERSGIINIGLEGMMLTGAFCAVLGTHLTGHPFIGVFGAILGGAFLGLLMAFFTIRLKADHVVCGVGINLLALGLTTWLMQIIWGSRGTSQPVQGLSRITIPFLRDIPYLGPLLGSHSPLVYSMFFITFVGWYLLFKTSLGLRIRMVGEHPEAADTLGIKVHLLQYLCVIGSGSLAALGGAYLSIGELNWFSMNMSAGRGYMALAANIFGQWNPIGCLLASFLFSLTDALQMRLQIYRPDIASELIQMVPYILTIMVLAGAVIRSRPPASLGKHYQSGGG